MVSHFGQARGVSSQRWKEPVDSLRTGSEPERMAAILRFILVRLSLRSEFGEDEADAAYDVVSRGFVGGERQELNREVPGVGAEDKTAFVEVDEAEKEGGAASYGVERGLMGAVGRKRVVVAVEDGDGAGGDEWVHGRGLMCVGADGEEALPVGVFGGGAGAIVMQARGGDLNGFDDGGRGDAGFVHGGRGRDDGDDLDGAAGVGWSGRRWGESVDVKGQKLVDGKVLRGEDAVEAFERKGPFFIEEVGDVGLLKSGLLGESAAGEDAAFDAALKFDAEKFVQVLKVHERGLSMANHIIRQDEDKAKLLLCAIDLVCKWVINGAFVGMVA